MSLFIGRIISAPIWKYCPAQMTPGWIVPVVVTPGVRRLNGVDGGELDERDHLLPGEPEAEILDLQFEVADRVFEGEAVVETVRGAGCRRSRSWSGNSTMRLPVIAKGFRYWTESRQVAEALAPVEARRHRREIGLCERGDSPGMPPADPEPGQPHRLVFAVDEQLVLCTGRHCIETGDCRHAGLLHEVVGVGPGQAEIGRDPFRDVRL